MRSSNLISQSRHTGGGQDCSEVHTASHSVASSGKYWCGIAIVLSFLSGKTELDRRDKMLIEYVRCILYGLYRTILKKGSRTSPSHNEMNDEPQVMERPQVKDRF
jgi:hypothetical protein